MKLVGFPNHHIRAIGKNLNGRATCIVIKYPLHNFDDGNGFYRVGGEGGEIRKTRQVGHRIIEHQKIMSPSNIGIHRDFFCLVGQFDLWFIKLFSPTTTTWVTIPLT